MTEEQKAIEKLKGKGKMDLISIIRTFKKEGIENFAITRIETIETVLNLIQKQETFTSIYEEVSQKWYKMYQKEHIEN